MGIRQTNISHLDRLLGGGLMHNTITLLSAHPGVENSAFAYHIITESLKEGDSCIYVTNSKSGLTVEREIAYYGNNVGGYINEERLIFVDAYSTLVNDAPGSRFFVESPRDIESITLALKKALGHAKDSHKVVVFDSVSTLIDQCGDKSIEAFNQWRELFAKYNATGLFLFTRWPYEYGVIERLEELSDTVIELNAIEEKVIIKEYLQISKIGWESELNRETQLPFRISVNEGVTILERGP